MSRKRVGNKHKLATKKEGKRKALIVMGLAFILIIASGALAQWAGFFSAIQSQSSDPSSATPQSMLPSSPSKEYVYAGSRLIATEEPASTPGCSYSISPTSQTFTSSGGTGSVAVTAGTGCSWTAASNATWLHITSGASGSGNGTVAYSADTNSAAQRTGTMIVAGQTFTVNQSAGSSSCSYTISTTNVNVAIGGGSILITVTAGAGCNWTAQSNATWITITAGASGSGNGTVSYQVAANTGAARTGTLTIAGLTFTLSQGAAGAPPAPTLTATALSATSIRIDWSFVPDGISIFKIERKTGTSGTYAQITSADTAARTYTDTKRITHTTYCYRVRAYNGQDGPYSNEACATTP